MGMLKANYHLGRCGAYAVYRLLYFSMCDVKYKLRFYLGFVVDSNISCVVMD